MCYSLISKIYNPSVKCFLKVFVQSTMSVLVLGQRKILSRLNCYFQKPQLVKINKFRDNKSSEKSSGCYIISTLFRVGCQLFLNLK